MALLKIAEATGETSYDEAGRRVCDYTLNLQDADGLFWAMPSKDFVFTHAHCYACEGFLSAGAYTGDERYTEAALKGITWLKNAQNPDGSVFQVYADHRGMKHKLRRAIDAFKAADATSQAARLFMLAGEGYEEPYERAVNFIKGCKLYRLEACLRGGLCSLGKAAWGPVGDPAVDVGVERNGHRVHRAAEQVP